LASDSFEGGILQKGTWALSPYPDPFNKRYPVVGYIPAGTIIFEMKDHPDMRKYVEVLTHFGHRVLIEKLSKIKNKRVKSVIEFEGLVEPPQEGNNKLILHKNILCLNEQDRIKTEDAERCYFKKDPDDLSSERSTPKLGKGWIYSFEPKSGSSKWYTLEAQLDPKTKEIIESYDLEVVNANFDIPIDELEGYEEDGFITLLNKKMPLIVFEYLPSSLFFLECGLQKVDRKFIEGKLSASLSATSKKSLSTKFFSWITGVDASMTADGAAGLEKESKKTINTNESSYLFYDVKKIDRETGEESVITVKKEFSCLTGATNIPGLDVTDIRFIVKSDPYTDPDIYVFDKSEDFINTPKENKKAIGRPVFVSVNSVSQYQKLLKIIKKKYNVSTHMAHFMLVNINNTCKDGNVRKTCLQLSKQKKC